MEYIRLLNKNDYILFKELINDFRETEFTQDIFEQTLNYITQYSDIWVIEKNKQLIACATIMFEKKFIFNICTLAHIEDVCVKKEYRNNGYGKLLLTNIIQKAIDKKCYKITLNCNNNNIDFYKKCGFELRANQMTILLN
jgi:glucosamine-phosphate N-acetyltransferase